MENNQASLQESNRNESVYLEFKVLKVAGLSQKSSKSVLQPYISVSQLSKEWMSNCGEETSEFFEWKEAFNLKIDTLRSFAVSILNKPLEEESTLLYRLIIPPYMTEDLAEKGKKIWVRLDKDKSEVLSPDKICDPGQDCPRIQVEMKMVDPNQNHRCQVRLGKHLNYVDAKEAYTLYEFHVNSKDLSKIVSLRYSQIDKLRDELILSDPSLSKVPFPNKTYFDWTAFLCVRRSRFDANRIKERALLLEKFLNFLLDHPHLSHATQLVHLLKIDN